MTRPRNEHPTPAELETLKILWTEGPSTVRQVLERIEKRPRPAYTSVMSLLNVMAEKGLVSREVSGRAFVYRAAVARTKTLRGMLDDLLGRAFDGSASSLVTHLLDGAKPSPQELEEIRRTLDEHLEEGNDTP